MRTSRSPRSRAPSRSSSPCSRTAAGACSVPPARPTESIGTPMRLPARRQVRRRGWDSNPRNRLTRLSDFQDRRIRPLCHPSGERAEPSSPARPSPTGQETPVPPMPAVAVRVLRQVLLVVRLGVVERAGGGDLGRDLAEAGRGQRRLVAVARRLDRGALLVRAVVDGRAVLRADVVALAHALRRVVALPERAQDLVARHLRGVEHDEHGLGVAGRAAADLLVGRVRRVAAGVADGGRVDAVELPEQPLGAPEAAHADDQRLHAARGTGGWSGVPRTSWRSGTAIAVSRPGSARSASIIFVFSRNRNMARRSSPQSLPRRNGRDERITLGCPGEVAEWLKALAC